MIDYQDKKVIIVGLGLTGLSCVNFFLKRGVIPCVVDIQTNPPGLEKLPREVNFHLGNLERDWILTADMVVVSPGVGLSCAFLSDIANTDVEIVGDIELFCREIKSPIIAITGSNGKSTVTKLVGEMAKSANIDVGICGNIGLPALDLLNRSYELYVIELSSFQLETTNSLHATAATILNISEDHMDRYPNGLHQYRSAKLRIYNNAETCVINVDNALTIPVHGVDNRCISFGMNIGDYHLMNQKDEIWICIKEKKILNVKEMKLSYNHNYANALAALALADAIGLPKHSNLEALKTFSGLPYCLQLVLEKNGIRWINDSKSTNVSSTKAALNSLKIDGTLHLLLGGKGKSTDFSLLKPHLLGNNIQLYCFGQDGSKLAALRPDVSQKTETMEEAIHSLKSRLQSGDVVLLSPACSSLDQFKSFEHRGEIFTSLAKEIG